MARTIQQEMATGTPFLSTILRFFIENTPRQHKHSAKKAIGASPLQFFDSSIEPALVRTARTIDWDMATGALFLSTILQFLNGTASCQDGKIISAENGHGYAHLS